MDVTRIIEDLRREHAQVVEAIAALERMASASGKRRGRPPAWLLAARQASEAQTPVRRASRRGNGNQLRPGK